MTEGAPARAPLFRASEQPARREVVGEEAQKGGCPVGELPALLAQARDAGIPIAGLMCIPPLDIEAAPFFALLDKLARDHGLEGLSMGMSGDYETAIMLGATHVRVGTALFGERA